jgi:hypothetical protein
MAVGSAHFMRVDKKIPLFNAETVEISNVLNMYVCI